MAVRDEEIRRGGPFSAAAFSPDERHVAISTFNSPTTVILRAALEPRR